jgi:hypothetical protein
MADHTQIWLRQGEHMLIVGQTQSGKSVVATTFARGFDAGSMVVYDPKRDPDAILPNCHVTRDYRDVIRHIPGRVVWQPKRMALALLRAQWDEICSRLLELAEAGYCSTVVEHELTDLADASIGPAHRQIITQGAKIAGGPERGGGSVGAILVTQRPRNIPVIARSEMRHVVCLVLNEREDREYVAGLMEDKADPAGSRAAVATIALPNDYSWWYRGPEHRLTLHHPVALPH